MGVTKALASVAVGALIAPFAVGQSLDETLALAEFSNPVLDISEAEAAIAREALREARAQGRVNVTLSASYGVQSVESDDPFNGQVGEDTLATAQLEAALPIYTGGRIRAGVRSARAGIEAADARLEAERQAIYFQAISAFLNVSAARASVDIRENNVALLEEQLEAAEARFRVGFITRTDVALTQSRLAGARSGLASAQADLERFVADFGAVTGVAPGELGPIPPTPLLPMDFDEALANLLEFNPQLIGFRQDVLAASEAVTVEAAAGRPQIDIVGTASGQEEYTEDFTDSTVSAFARATIPLWQGGRVNSRVRSAKLAREQARFQVQAAERDLRASLATAWFGFIAAELAIDASQSEVDAAEIAFDGAQRELAVGTRTTLEVLDAEQDLLNARLGLVQAERDAQLAAYTILQTTGLLTRDRILPVAAPPALP